MEGHVKARKEGAAVTDDVAILELIGKEVHIVESHRLNIKVTHTQDLELCEEVSELFIGQINDVQRKP